LKTEDASLVETGLIAKRIFREEEQAFRQVAVPLAPPVRAIPARQARQEPVTHPEAAQSILEGHEAVVSSQKPATPVVNRLAEGSYASGRTS